MVVRKRVTNQRQKIHGSPRKGRELCCCDQIWNCLSADSSGNTTREVQITFYGLNDTYCSGMSALNGVPIILHQIPYPFFATVDDCAFAWGAMISDFLSVTVGLGPGSTQCPFPVENTGRTGFWAGMDCYPSLLSGGSCVPFLRRVASETYITMISRFCTYDIIELKQISPPGGPCYQPDFAYAEVVLVPP